MVVPEKELGIPDQESLKKKLMDSKFTKIICKTKKLHFPESGGELSRLNSILIPESNDIVIAGPFVLDTAGLGKADYKMDSSITAIESGRSIVTLQQSFNHISIRQYVRPQEIILDPKSTPPLKDSDFDFSYHGKNGGCPLTFCSSSGAKDNRKLIMGGTHGLIGVFTPDTNNLFLMRSQQFENYNVMVVKRLKALDNFYAFGTLKLGLHIVEIDMKKAQINQQNTFLRGKSVRDVYEYATGKLICAVSSAYEIWIVDYLH